MDAFDRARPLWELTLVEGLENGEAALIVKIHHSLSDGLGGMRMLEVIADQKRKPRRLGEMPPTPPGETVDQFALLTHAAGLMTTQLTGLARRGAEAAVPALLRSVRDPAGAARGTIELARSVYRTAGPSSGAMSPQMRDRATTRHLAMMEVSLDALKAAAKAADGTVNDAYLAVCYRRTAPVPRAPWHLRRVPARRRPGQPQGQPATRAGATRSPCSG